MSAAGEGRLGAPGEEPLRRRGQVAILTDAGWDKVVASAPGHVERVRQLVLDPLDADDLGRLDAVMVKLLDVLDPDAKFAATALARQV